MSTLREAAQQALEALEDMLGWESLAPQSVQDSSKQSLQRLREALAQPDPEPVAWMTINPYGEEDDISYEDPTMDLLDGWTCKPLYTQPPQREWIGLTDAELEEFSNMQLGAYDLCDAVEERLEEKNRG